MVCRLPSCGHTRNLRASFFSAPRENEAAGGFAGRCAKSAPNGPWPTLFPSIIAAALRGAHGGGGSFRCMYRYRAGFQVLSAATCTSLVRQVRVLGALHVPGAPGDRAESQLRSLLYAARCAVVLLGGSPFRGGWGALFPEGRPRYRGAVAVPPFRGVFPPCGVRKDDPAPF